MPKKSRIIEPINATMEEVGKSLLKDKGKQKHIIKLHATHNGNFKNDFGIDVDCYVLNDKSAVISQRGMLSALNISEGGGRLSRFLNSFGMSKYVAPELRKKIENPLVFQGRVVAPNGSILTPTTFGYDVSILIDICKDIIKASDDNALLKKQYDKQ